MKTICLIKPDDAHVHLRDGEQLMQTVPATAKRFARAIVMPNLTPAITTLPQVNDYKQRILAATPVGLSFQPLMTLYLNNQVTKETLVDAKKTAAIIGCKLYPKGATTHSNAGVENLQGIYSLLEVMQEQDLPLLIHGESTDPEIDVFDREKSFLPALEKIIKNFPKLRIVLEHITTQEAVEFVSQVAHPIAATITVHHLLFNRNQLFTGGIRPHYYCLPLLKRRRHQDALLKAATSGNPRFFLGTDSAPHAINTKEQACGCAGIYSAPAAIELYAEVFDTMHSLDKLEGFASRYAADFYRLPYHHETITLIQKSWAMPAALAFGNAQVVPLRADEMIAWQLLS